MSLDDRRLATTLQAGRERLQLLVSAGEPVTESRRQVVKTGRAEVGRLGRRPGLPLLRWDAPDELIDPLQSDYTLSILARIPKILEPGMVLHLFHRNRPHQFRDQPGQPLMHRHPQAADALPAKSNGRRQHQVGAIRFHKISVNYEGG